MKPRLFKEGSLGVFIENEKEIIGLKKNPISSLIFTLKEEKKGILTLKYDPSLTSESQINIEPPDIPFSKPEQFTITIGPDAYERLSDISSKKRRIETSGMYGEVNIYAPILGR